MDARKIIEHRAGELCQATEELRERVRAWADTGDFAPVSDQIVLLTQLVMGITGIGSVVEQRAAREAGEAALERVKRMLQPPGAPPRPLT